LVSRSAVWRRSTIGENSISDRCIVADDAIVEPGAHTVREVVMRDVRSTAETDWVAQQVLHVSEEAPLATRLGRLLLRASWSRRPAAQ